MNRFLPTPEHGLAFATLMCRLASLDERARLLSDAVEGLDGDAPRPTSVADELRDVRSERQKILQDLAASHGEGAWVRDPMRPREALCLVPEEGGTPRIVRVPYRLIAHAPPGIAPEAVDLARSRLRRGLA